ncbi:long-chain fatty acid--CoA ligase [Bosea vaviloviae]|uniref:Long-chain fatty acid--CoA ligase n=1 Tax=Bosea vaviloviae TaxID=1526658 RepID=A0A0N0MBK5_9HYPH|nr:long-chain fatty acid--CoA ligase [Bosea vaviloviae]
MVSRGKAWLDVTEAEIIEALLAFIDRDEASEAEFERMALDVFAYQFANNPPYRRFAIQRGRTTLTVRDWRDIPAVPITAFKDMTLSCTPPERAQRVFMTSGTTQGGVRGKSHHPTLAVWDRSMLVNFRARFMRGLERIEMGILFPDEEAMPNSSLAHYLALAKQECGTADSEGFIGADGLDLARLTAALERAQASGRPYALLGASYSFVHLLDALAAQGRRFALPKGSRILDTGGFKGQSREMGADAFYDALSAALGVDRSACINMYGMTELSTQFYDDGNAICPPVKSGPHWIRSRVVDPVSGRDLPEGSTGVLVHHDLAHFNCVSAILTEDAGIMVEGGFKLLGRVDGADSKGCSLAVAEFLKAARG